MVRNEICSMTTNITEDWLVWDWRSRVEKMKIRRSADRGKQENFKKNQLLSIVTTNPFIYYQIHIFLEQADQRPKTDFSVQIYLEHCGSHASFYPFQTLFTPTFSQNYSIWASRLLGVKLKSPWAFSLLRLNIEIWKNIYVLRLILACWHPRVTFIKMHASPLSALTYNTSSLKIVSAETCSLPFALYLFTN